MQHRRPTDRRSVLRALSALLVAGAVAGTTLAAAGGSARDPAADVLQIARQQLGDPYAWGGSGPNAWDCSGLTSYLWREVGKVDGIPRVSRDQQAWAVPIPREQLLVGDLVFFGNPVSHVALYAGDGKMVDASSAQKKVVERGIWTSGVVRYGRVPRPGMPAVTPWTPPPLPSPTATPRPSGSPSTVGQRASGSARPTPSPTAVPSARSAAPRPSRPTVAAAAAAPVPLRGLPAPNLPASSAVAARAAANATTVRGSRSWTNVALVRVAWQHSGGGALPGTLAGIEAQGQAVPAAAVRIGDLVLYGQPASHVGIYLGHGYMVDASRSLGRVVVRRVFVSPTVRFLRLPG